ncbi:hypothetical protein NDU88_007164 [Pleurodeles waltl]|uniref:Uncharacterized protein n=1 Tax=Pleurodeles waltl TaxID=8319 RepID=A0AAV7LR93_PLEWA|nr:hypothetical protein NDU88_007164 [Pleurodeles waltl]
MSRSRVQQSPTRGWSFSDPAGLSCDCPCPRATGLSGEPASYIPHYFNALNTLDLHPVENDRLICLFVHTRLMERAEFTRLELRHAIRAAREAALERCTRGSAREMHAMKNC